MAFPWVRGPQQTNDEFPSERANILVVVHSTLPLLAALVVICVVQKGQHNAATWSVASHTIQGSLWPFLLQGDASVIKNVPKVVFMCSNLVTIGSVILVVAHFLTPLPLISEIRKASTLEQVPFRYAPGESRSFLVSAIDPCRSKHLRARHSAATREGCQSSVFLQRHTDRLPEFHVPISHRSKLVQW